MNEENDSDNDSDTRVPTVEEILSTVLNRKTKLGHVKLDLGLSANKRRISQQSSQSSLKVENGGPVIDTTQEKPNNNPPIPSEPLSLGRTKQPIETLNSSSNLHEPKIVQPKILERNTILSSSMPTTTSLTKKGHFWGSLTAGSSRSNIGSYNPLTPKTQSNSKLHSSKSTGSVVLHPVKESSSSLTLLRKNHSLSQIQHNKVERHEVPCEDAQPTETSKHQLQYISVNNKQYQLLKQVGKGGSSDVFSVFDMEDCESKAVKIVKSDLEDNSSFQMQKDEIKILQRLSDQSRIIKLYDFEETPNKLKIVMELGTLDLRRILFNMRQDNSKLDDYTIKHYWKGMLLAVQQIHEKGIIHSDLKPGNFLLVGGTLKLIDFGIASSLQSDQTSIFKDTQAGTFDYMSPESLIDVQNGPIVKCTSSSTVIKIGVKSDVWSLGCILYSMVYKKAPFNHLKVLEKLTAISNPNYPIKFEPINDQNLLNVMKSCLKFNPRERPSIEDLLEHPYLCS